MNHYIVTKSTLSGEIKVPSSKSQTLRAILFASMADGKSIIYQCLPSPDTMAMVDACRLFGAKIELFPDHMKIEGLRGNVDQAKDIIHAGNSGIVLRFCSAIGALGTLPVVITGDDSIKSQRPMQDLLQGLAQAGVFAESLRGDGYAPVIIKGPIKPGKVTLSGEDSQPVSAFLIASAFCRGEMEIVVQNPGEKPWVALTLDWFDRLGIPYENDSYKRYRLFGSSRYSGFTYTVPGDLSTAAFAIAAALITQSELTLRNVDMNDRQGDKELIYVLQRMGANIEIDEASKTLHVKKGRALQGIDVDINDFVDAFPILSVVGCFAKGVTTIHNGAVARNKECNRISAIANELRKMGAFITEKEDGVIINGSVLRAADVYSYQDHRMAMSLAVAGMGSLGVTKVSPVTCISKTFPSFFEDFSSFRSKYQGDGVSLILVGLPMSGKTSVGTILAEKLKKPFIDTDELVTKAYAKKAGKVLSPREIFTSEGEKFFRSLEKLQIASLAKEQNSVIAIGGGSLLDLENKRVLSSIGKVVYLKTIPSLLWQRINTCGVPAFLDPSSPEQAFYALAKKREPLYESVATITIDVSNLAKETIVESIMREISYGE